MSFRENRVSGDYRPYRGRGGFRGRGRGGGDFNGRRRSPSPNEQNNGFRRGGGGNRYQGGGGGGSFVSRRRSHSPRPHTDYGDQTSSYRPRGGGRGFFRGGDRGGYTSQREYRRPYDDAVSYPQNNRGGMNGHFRSQGIIYRNEREDFADSRSGARRRQYSPGPPINVLRNGSPPMHKFERREFMQVPRDRYSPQPQSYRMPVDRNFEPRFVPRGGGGGGTRRYYSPEPAQNTHSSGSRGRGGFRHQQDFGGPQRAPRFEDRRRGPPQDLPPRFDRNSDLGGPPPFKRSRPGPGGPYKRRGASPVSP